MKYEFWVVNIDGVEILDGMNFLVDFVYVEYWGDVEEVFVDE